MTHVKTKRSAGISAPKNTADQEQGTKQAVTENADVVKAQEPKEKLSESPGLFDKLEQAAKKKEDLAQEEAEVEE